MTGKGTTAAAGRAAHRRPYGIDGGGTPYHPTPQTPEELKRECLGTIAGAGRDIERTAMEGSVDALKTHVDFLEVQMRRLETIMTAVRTGPREF